MRKSDTPIGEVVLVGRAAYQLYSHTFRGNVQYRADVGKPWTNKETGQTIVLPFMQDDSTRDFVDAAEKAAKQLEELRTAAFRHKVHSNAASITPLVETTVEEELDCEAQPELKLANG